MNITYDTSIRTRDVFFFDEDWEAALGTDLLMSLDIPHSVWDDLELDVENNPYFDSDVVEQFPNDFRSYTRRMVTTGHSCPARVPTELWVPGDYILAQRPQRLLKKAIDKHYYHPILLLKREPTRKDERALRKALELPREEGSHIRPVIMLGNNPKRHFLPNTSPKVPNPLGPDNFPWAIGILVTSGAVRGNPPRNRKLWVGGDKFCAAAARRRRKGENGVTMKQVIWERLRQRQTLLDLLPRSMQPR